MEHKTKLQAWMAEKGYTNRQLAEKMGLSYEYIYKLANGKVEVSDRRTFKYRFVECFGWDEANRVFDVVPLPKLAVVA